MSTEEYDVVHNPSLSHEIRKIAFDFGAISLNPIIFFTRQKPFSYPAQPRYFGPLHLTVDEPCKKCLKRKPDSRSSRSLTHNRQQNDFKHNSACLHVLLKNNLTFDFNFQSTRRLGVIPT
jgi:hypothetical protein